MSDELKRTLSAKDIAILTVGGVIGSGIFLGPSTVLRQSGGSVGLSLLIWIAGGLLSYLGALTYAELAAMNSEPGGLYIYIRDGFGRLPAFLYGWTLFFVISSGTVATLAVGTVDYLGQFATISTPVRYLITTAICAILAWINVLGSRQSATVMNVSTVLKVGAIAVLVIALPIGGHGLREVGPWLPTTFSLGMLPAIGVATVAVLWAYEGWQYVTFVAGETIEPQRNFPRGLAWGTFALIVIYVAAVLAYVAGIGPTQVAASNRVAAEATEAVLGPFWGKAIAIPIIISMLSAAHANVFTAARVYYAMARDGVFFRKMGEVHPKWGTPAFAIVTSSIWAAILSLSGSFETLFTYVVFIGWIFYGLAGLAVIALRKKYPTAPRPYKVPGYPVSPILFALSAAAIVVSTLADDPKKVLGVAAALVGIPVFYFWRRRASSSSTS